VTSTKRSLRRAGAASLAALALAAAVSGCTNAHDQPRTAASPQQQPSLTWSSDSAMPEPSTAPASASDAPSASGTTTATPTTAPLDWKPLPGDATNTVVTNGTRTLTVGERGDWWSLGRKRTSVPRGEQVMKAGLNGSFAVVVYGKEAGSTPQTAVITTLDTGRISTLDASSEVPPASDGSWSLFGSTLWYATGGGAKPYCLASADLVSGHESVGWCADAHHGFTNIMAADGEPTSMMTFDDARPTSCRTLVTLSDSGKDISPVPGVPACKGSQAVGLAGGTVWSIVPDEHRYQQVRVYASSSSGVTDLGLGTNGTLVACGDSVFWTKDATGSTPAALMRWDGSALTTAYETKGLLGQPLCAAGHLSIVESGDAGDRQLTASVN
jgi:hypothetical protein